MRRFRESRSRLTSFANCASSPICLRRSNCIHIWREVLRAEAERLVTCRSVLVHGDFSPKNLLVSGDRLVIIDCEVAWYGDPAFDLAFLLNHLCLKALYHAPAHGADLRVAGRATCQAYQDAWLNFP